MQECNTPGKFRNQVKRQFITSRDQALPDKFFPTFATRKTWTAFTETGSRRFYVSDHSQVFIPHCIPSNNIFIAHFTMPFSSILVSALCRTTLSTT